MSLIPQWSPSPHCHSDDRIEALKPRMRALGPTGVRVTAIALSITRNEKIERAMSAERQHRVAESLPLRRLGEPRDDASPNRET
jgi:hypothetical protein